MQTKVAVFGDKDFCLPFSALGMDIFPANQAEGLIAIAQTIVDDGSEGLDLYSRKRRNFILSLVYGNCLVIKKGEEVAIIGR